MMTSHITKATINDIPQLLKLVNNAYRGDEARKGWTHEADLIEGTLRINEEALSSIFENQDATVLTYKEDNEGISGCVYLEKKEAKLYLGMLSVHPYAQAKGIGKKLLQASEAYAREQGIHTIEMTVISVRHELIAWYERNGYCKTGRTIPFPDDDRFGTPRFPIEFIVLEKQL